MSIDLDERKVARNEAGMWLGWTVATGLGMLLGMLPFSLLGQGLPVWMVRVLIPIVAGLLVGVFQWLVLRRYMTHTVDWILNGGAGWALGFSLGLLVIQVLDESPLGALVGYLLFGLIVALIQWPILRREIPNVIPWALANVVGWALGAYVSQAILNALVNDPTANPVLGTAVLASLTGLIAGAVTGAALVWTVRQPDLADQPVAERGK